MAIGAPWERCRSVKWEGMPIVSALVVANTLAIFILSTCNAAAVELDEHNQDVVKDRAGVHPGPVRIITHSPLPSVPVLFWCTVPFALTIATISELFCLWTDRLAPVWVLISSTIAVCVWAAQMTLWQLCVGSVRPRPTPDFCPNSYDTFFTWCHASASSAPAAAVPTIFILQVAQASSIERDVEIVPIHQHCISPQMARLIVVIDPISLSPSEIEHDQHEFYNLLR
ncbi:hypothetical protein CERZMDRAFT_95713 [Cercospora zeae-maydis SCOH1-5]|uniref:Uncharacterized protein n=1 Tax=Cercospora zeae-maydis SCOH1-5 TaxID=717836 RepID=A0A6A6FMK6_9PEZI|nr:hypothetical protein CERZMDRAFT_95713 [Cercospora zeae-maydis SCOH1-5]